jgi:hypothetical protein
MTQDARVRVRARGASPLGKLAMGRGFEMLLLLTWMPATTAITTGLRCVS